MWPQRCFVVFALGSTGALGSRCEEEHLCSGGRERLADMYALSSKSNREFSTRVPPPGTDRPPWPASCSWPAGFGVECDEDFGPALVQVKFELNRLLEVNEKAGTISLQGQIDLEWFTRVEWNKSDYCGHCVVELDPKAAGWYAA